MTPDQIVTLKRKKREYERARQARMSPEQREETKRARAAYLKAWRERRVKNKIGTEDPQDRKN